MSDGRKVLQQRDELGRWELVPVIPANELNAREAADLIDDLRTTFPNQLANRRPEPR